MTPRHVLAKVGGGSWVGSALLRPPARPAPPHRAPCRQGDREPGARCGICMPCQGSKTRLPASRARNSSPRPTKRVVSATLLHDRYAFPCGPSVDARFLHAHVELVRGVQVAESLPRGSWLGRRGGAGRGVTRGMRGAVPRIPPKPAEATAAVRASSRNSRIAQAPAGRQHATPLRRHARPTLALPTLRSAGALLCAHVSATARAADGPARWRGRGGG